MTRQQSSKEAVAYDPDTRGPAILIGVSFLVATLTFLVGDALITSAFDASDSLVKSSDLTVGAVLISLCAIAVVVIGVAAYRVLRSRQPGLATGYLIFRILEGVVIVAVAGYMVATSELISYEAAIYIFTGVGGLMFAVALDRTGLIPSWLARLGIVGYVAIALSAPLDVFGIASLDSPVGMLLYVPGAVFELVLPILLIVRGFRLVGDEPGGPAPRSAVM
jgi:hypothetical protein